jgi:hypothetical protein
MGIFDKFDKLRNPALLDLLRDQRLKELITRREFRVTEEYFHREFVSKTEDDEIRKLSLKFRDGYGELAGEVKKRFIPFAVPFSARFAMHGVDFSPQAKKIHLRVEEVKPFDFDWVTRRVVGKIPFLAYGEGVVSCDLTRVPRLAEFFASQVKGVRLCDFLTVRDVAFREGEIVGRLGVSL